MTGVNRKRIVLTLIAVLSASLPAAAAASTAAQAAPTAGRPSAIPVFSGVLGGVSATSPTDAWAVGDQCPTCNDSTTLILHWNGTRWSLVPSPNPGPKLNVLNAVAAVSPAYAWAVGSNGNSACTTAATVILHWNGTAWVQVKSPNAGACNELEAVTTISASNAWAVGGSCKFAVNTCHTLILHWNGVAWSKVASPSSGTGGLVPLAGVSADSPSDAWAVGGTCTTSTCAVQNALLLHWNGTAWSKVPSPDLGPGSVFPLTVSADSPSDAWAAGSYCTTSTCAVQDTLLLHWNGTAWSKVPSPDPGPLSNSLNGVIALSPTDAWATGAYCAPRCEGHADNLILHWNGTTWARVHSPDPGKINEVGTVAAATPSSAWTVGFTCVTSVCGVNANALILHWDGTAWTRSAG
jgi:hypothetical protein